MPPISPLFLPPISRPQKWPRKTNTAGFFHVVKNVGFSRPFLGVRKWGAKIGEKWGAFLGFSQYIAKKIIRLGFYTFPRPITLMTYRY